jgi:uncharacterized protein (DUF302 family)
MDYYFSKKIDGNFDATKEKVVAALQTEGFGILSEIDVQATMKKKLDKDYNPYLILGACNPVFADKVLSLEPNIGTLLPCNVILRELEKGQIEVAFMDPASAMAVVDNEEINPLAKEVKEKLLRAFEKIQS